MLFPPTKLSEQEKLETLQRLDRFRHWYSLDYKRYCLVCGAIITGRDVGVIGGERDTGPLRVICPTRNCHSIPLDWVVPSDEVLAKTSARAAWRPRTRARQLYARSKASHSIASRLRRFSGYLKR
jgi:hypothetical protein